MINISLSDLIAPAETHPAASAARPGDAAAFSGFLNQFDRSRAEDLAQPSRPQRARPERDDVSRDQRDTQDKDDVAPRRAAPKTREPASAPETAETTVTTELAAAVMATSQPKAESADSEETAGAMKDAGARNDSLLEIPAVPTFTAAAIDTTESPVVVTATMQNVATASEDTVNDLDIPLSTSATAKDQTTPDATADVAIESAKQSAAPKSAMNATPDNDTRATSAKSDGQPAHGSPDASSRAQAQSVDLGKRVDSAALQIAVRVADDKPTPHKTPVSLANGMHQSADGETASQTMSTTQSQTATAVAPVQATTNAEYAAARLPQMPAAGGASSVAPTALSTAMPAVAVVAPDETAPDVRTAGAAKFAIPESAAVGGASANTTSSSAAQSAAPVPSPKPTPLPHPATEQIAVHVAKASADGLDKINVKLKPATLGHVEIQLDLASDGRVHVAVSADRADTLDLLQRDARALERALNDAGLQTDQQSLSFNLRDHGQPQRDGRSENAVRDSFGSETSGFDADDAPVHSGYANARAAVGGLDIRV